MDGKVTKCIRGNLLLSVERSADDSRFIFVRKVKKSETRTPWNSRRWFLANMCTLGKSDVQNIKSLS